MTGFVLRTTLTAALVLAGVALPACAAVADAWDDVEIVVGPSASLGGYVDQTSAALQRMIDLLGAP